MKELITIQNELKAPKNMFNSFGNYKYRNLEGILEAVKPLLKANECVLTISDKPICVGEWHYIEATATLTNKDGEVVSVTASARESENKKGMDDSQITGTASSYARKYACNGLFAIDDTKDADTDEYHTATSSKSSITGKKSSKSTNDTSNEKKANLDDFTFEQKMGGLKKLFAMMGEAQQEFLDWLLGEYGYSNLDDIKENEIDAIGKVAKNLKITNDNRKENASE